MRIREFGGYWTPSDVNNSLPFEIGALVAWNFKPWRVVDFKRDVEPRETDKDQGKYEYFIVILRPVGIDLDQTAHSNDVHLWGSELRGYWKDPLARVFDRLHEHYGLCVHCNELLPCRDRMAERQAEKQTAEMSRYETPGVCPACMEPVTHRQAHETFPNIYVPLGEPVTFHAGRRACKWEMERYRGKVGQPETQLRLDGGKS